MWKSQLIYVFAIVDSLLYTHTHIHKVKLTCANCKDSIMLTKSDMLL